MYLVALIILVLIALGFILFPYLKGRQEVENIPPDIAVYKAQLRELDSDIEKGLIDEAEAKRSRIEIERRLLKAASEQQKEVSTEKPAHLITALIGLIIIFSGYFYYLVGTPAMPDFPKSMDTGMSGDEAAAAQIKRIQDLKERVLADLEENPDRVEAWVALGQFEMTLGNYQKSAEALNRARLLQPDNFDYQLMYAESLIAASGQRVVPATKIILNRAAKMEPDNPGPKFYFGLADYQDGEIEKARDAWQSIRAELDPDHPMFALIGGWVNRANSDLGIAMEVPAGRAPSINQEQVEAIMEMDESEQQELIRQMVAQLAAKQEENPTNIQGWLQLSRSYLMLGEREKAIAAMQAAADNAPADQKDILQKEVEKLTNMP